MTVRKALPILLALAIIGVWFYRAFLQPLPVLLLGDSIFARWSAPGTLNAVNGGQGGATSGDALYALRSHYTDRYAVVFIEVGSNDLGAGLGDATFQENVRQIAWLALQRGATPALCTLLPVARFVEPQRHKADILRLNVWLRDYAAERGYPLVNLYTPLADSDGYLSSDLSLPDGLHPNEAGYRLIFGELYDTAYGKK